MERNILLIEDDAHLRQSVKNTLENHGFNVILSKSWQSGLELAPSPDWAFIVTTESSRKNGSPDFLPELRKRSRAPVLMLISLGKDAGGAAQKGDSRSGKQFQPSIPLPKSRSGRGKATGTAKEVFMLNHGRIRLDLYKRQVLRDGSQVELTAREFDLLVYFARNQGRALSKKEIYNQVWKGDYIFDDNTIMVHIRRLRMKIEDDPSDPKLIQTLRGVGYRFVDN